MKLKFLDIEPVCTIIMQVLTHRSLPITWLAFATWHNDLDVHDSVKCLKATMWLQLELPNGNINCMKNFISSVVYLFTDIPMSDIFRSLDTLRLYDPAVRLEKCDTPKHDWTIIMRKWWILGAYLGFKSILKDWFKFEEKCLTIDRSHKQTKLSYDLSTRILLCHTHCVNSRSFSEQDFCLFSIRVVASYDSFTRS